MWFFAAVGSAVLFGLTGFFMKVSPMRQGSTPHLLLGLYLTGKLGFAVNSLWEGSLFLDDWRVWVSWHHHWRGVSFKRSNTSLIGLSASFYYPINTI